MWMYGEEDNIQSMMKRSREHGLGEGDMDVIVGTVGRKLIAWQRWKVFCVMFRMLKAKLYIPS
jgi:hypothetical protein